MNKEMRSLAVLLLAFPLSATATATTYTCGNLEKPSLSRAQAAYFPPPRPDTRTLA